MVYIIEASYDGGPWRAWSTVLRKDKNKAIAAKTKAIKNYTENRGSAGTKKPALFRIKKVDMRDPVNKTKYKGMPIM